MATTVTPAISNSIGLAAEYLPLLDEIYKAESKTAILDTAQDMVRWDGATGSFYMFETDMVGLGDYSRSMTAPDSSLLTALMTLKAWAWRLALSRASSCGIRSIQKSMRFASVTIARTPQTA